MDADGEAFGKALEAQPNMIKPNRAELESYLGMSTESDTSGLLDAAKRIRQTGIENIVVSMGQDGALFLMENDEFMCDGLSVKVSSTVGAGDAMVAAFAYAWECKFSKEETVKLCMAASAGAVTTVGTKPPSKEVVDELKKQVYVQQL